MTMYIVSTQKLGLPKASREGFELLQENQLINNYLANINEPDKL